MNKEVPIVDQFSSHLFWDTDRKVLDPDEHRAYIIKQVLEYGTIED